MNRSKIAIIVPVYNVEKYIYRCVESLLNQTYKELSIWLVDDCSTDKSYEICKTISMKDSRINLLRNEKNSGAGKTRNQALNNIMEDNTIEYISFVDSDDYIDPSYIEYMYQLSAKSQADIIWTKNHTVEDTAEVKFFENNTDDFVYQLTGKELLMRDHERIMYSMLWGKLFKKELWDGIRIAEDYRWYEDGASTFKVLYKANKIVISDRKLYYYCYSANSSIRGKLNEERLKCGLDTALVKIDFYKEKGEKELMEIAYVGYINDILNVMMQSKMVHNGKKIHKEMWKLYKNNYQIGVKCKHITHVQRFKYVFYRMVPWSRSAYVKIKCKIMGYN